MKAIREKYKTAIPPTVFDQEKQIKKLESNASHKNDFKKKRVLSQLQSVRNGTGISLLTPTENTEAGLLTLLTYPKAAITEALMVELQQILNSEEDSRIDKAFIDAFILWIQGKVVETEDNKTEADKIKQRTWWWWRNKKGNRGKSGPDGPIPKDYFYDPLPLHGDDFVAYLRGIVGQKYDFMREMEKLKGFVPQNLKTAWLYWKYVVMGTPTLDSDYLNIVKDLVTPNPRLEFPEEEEGVDGSLQNPLPPNPLPPPHPQEAQFHPGPPPTESGPTDSVVNPRDNQPSRTQKIVQLAVNNPNNAANTLITPTQRAPEPPAQQSSFARPDPIIEYVVVNQSNPDDLSQIRNLKQQLQQAQSVPSRVVENPQTLEELINLRAALREKETTSKEYEERRKRHEQEKGSLTLALEAQRKEIESGRTSVSQLRNDVSKLEQELRSRNLSSSQADELRQQLGMAKEKINSVHSEMIQKVGASSQSEARLRSTLETRERELQSLTASSSHQQTEMREQFSRDKALFESNFRSLSEERNLAKQEIAQLRSNQTLGEAEKNQKISELERSRTEMKSELENLRNESKGFKQREAGLKEGDLKRQQLLERIEEEKNKLSGELSASRKKAQEDLAHLEGVKSRSEEAFQKKLNERNVELQQMTEHSQGLVQRTLQLENLLEEEEGRLTNLVDFLEKDKRFFSGVEGQESQILDIDRELSKANEQLHKVRSMKISRQVSRGEDDPMAKILKRREKKETKEVRRLHGEMNEKMKEIHSSAIQQLEKWKKEHEQSIQIMNHSYQQELSRLQKQVQDTREENLQLLGKTAQVQEQKQMVENTYQSVLGRASDAWQKFEKTVEQREQALGHGIEKLTQENLNLQKYIEEMAQLKRVETEPQVQKERGPLPLALTNEKISLEEHQNDLQLATMEGFAKINAKLNQEKSALENLEQGLVKFGYQEKVDFNYTDFKIAEFAQADLSPSQLRDELFQLDQNLVANEMEYSKQIATVPNQKRLQNATSFLALMPPELEEPTPNFKNIGEVGHWYENKLEETMSFFTENPKLEAYRRPVEMQLQTYSIYSQIYLKNPTDNLQLARGGHIKIEGLNQASIAMITTHGRQIERIAKEENSSVEKVVEQQIVPYMRAAEKGNLSYSSVLALMEGSITSQTVEKLAGTPSQLRLMLTNVDETRQERENMKEMFNKAIGNLEMRKLLGSEFVEKGKKSHKQIAFGDENYTKKKREIEMKTGRKIKRESIVKMNRQMPLQITS